jgi:hypothetical protein
MPSTTPVTYSDENFEFLKCQWLNGKTEAGDLIFPELSLIACQEHWQKITGNNS